MKSDKFELMASKAMKAKSFANEYGEKFTIYCDGMTVYFASDETDWEVVNLFNDKFNIWNSEELYRLGQCLMLLNAERTNITEKNKKELP